MASCRLLVVMGSPGAGKGTQAKILVDALQLAHLSTGDLLRAEIKKASPVGIEAKAHIDRGQLVPDATVLQMVREQLVRECSAGRGSILDGFPRNLNQARELDRMLVELELEIERVVFLTVPEEVVKQRLEKRQSEGREPRSDDRPEVVRSRLELFGKVMTPVLDYYAQRGRLLRIDGNQPVDKVTEAILEALNSAQRGPKTGNRGDSAEEQE